ncbi:hypothetical protein AAC387_Pa10g1049 [Persea americana]
MKFSFCPPSPFSLSPTSPFISSSGLDRRRPIPLLPFSPSLLSSLSLPPSPLFSLSPSPSPLFSLPPPPFLSPHIPLHLRLRPRPALIDPSPPISLSLSLPFPARQQIRQPGNRCDRWASRSAAGQGKEGRGRDGEKR